MLFDLSFIQESLFPCLPDTGIKALLIDIPQTSGRYFQGDPFPLFLNIESLGLEVGIEPSFGFDIRMGNAVPNDHAFSGDLTNP
jgi:hypothetical protein